MKKHSKSILLATFLLFIFVLFPSCSKENKEPKDKGYINIQSNFVYTQPGTEMRETMVYGASVEEASQASKYFVPVFDVNKDVWLTIEMSPSLISWPRKLKRVVVTDPEPIPVIITIEKAKNIQVSQYGGIESDSLVEEIDGTARYSFTIKNKKNSVYGVRFKFHPAAVGDSKIHVTYGLPEKQIVEKTCNIFTTIEFQ